MLFAHTGAAPKAGPITVVVKIGDAYIEERRFQLADAVPDSTTRHSVISATGRVKSADAVRQTFVMTTAIPMVGTNALGAPQVTITRRDTTFRITQETRLKFPKGQTSVHAGDAVTVGGRVQPDGTVLATSLVDGDVPNGTSVSTSTSQSQSAASGPGGSSFSVSTVNGLSHYRAVAPVKSVDTDRLTFAAPANKMSQDWAFVVTPQTVFRGVRGLRDLHPGERVTVEGDSRPDGTVGATRIER